MEELHTDALLAFPVRAMPFFDPTAVPSDAKFRELVLFIARKSEGDEQFGATKLNKLLFFCDFLAYRQFGAAITRHRYQRLEKGPAPRALLPILNEMENRGDIVRVERNYYGRSQKRVIARREPDLDLFSAKEVDLVATLIRENWDKSATQMSDLSHNFRGWKLAADGEDIPYEAALVKFTKPTAGDRKDWLENATELKRLAREHLASDSP